MTSLWAPEQIGPHNHKLTEKHKHAEHQDATDIQNKLIFCVFRMFFFRLLKWFLQEMLSY